MCDGEGDSYFDIVSGYVDFSDHVEINYAYSDFRVENCPKALEGGLLVDQCLKLFLTIILAGKVFTCYYPTQIIYGSLHGWRMVLDSWLLVRRPGVH